MEEFGFFKIISFQPSAMCRDAFLDQVNPLKFLPTEATGVAMKYWRISAAWKLIFQLLKKNLKSFRSCFGIEFLSTHFQKLETFQRNGSLWTFHQVLEGSFQLGIFCDSMW